MLKNEKKYENALELFINAEQKFKEVYIKAKEKKDKASISIEELEKKLKEFQQIF